MQHGDAAPALESSFGTRFRDETYLAVDGGWKLKLENNKLFAAQGKGKGTLVAKGVDPSFGCFALWRGAEGLTLIYRSANELHSAYVDGLGAWVNETLPYNIDFDSDHSLGLVGGELWFSFRASDGDRYVVALKGQHWSEVGSATFTR
jgi:hypothetical protein